MAFPSDFSQANARQFLLINGGRTIKKVLRIVSLGVAVRVSNPNPFQTVPTPSDVGLAHARRFKWSFGELYRQERNKSISLNLPLQWRLLHYLLRQI